MDWKTIIVVGVVSLVVLYVGGVLFSQEDSLFGIPGAGESSALEEGQWQMSQYADSEGISSVLPETSVTAEFDGTTMGGNASCNQYNANYQLGEDGSITIAEEIATTLKLCPEPVMDQEFAYLNLLPQAVYYTVEGDNMYFQDSDRQVLVEYVRLEPMALENTLWRATGVNNGRGGVVSSATTERISAEFVDGIISGSAGCNSYTGGYVVDGESIEIGQLVSTEMFCDDDELMAQEAEYLQALEKAEAYSIRDDSLELRDGGGSLQVSYSAVETLVSN